MNLPEPPAAPPTTTTSPAEQADAILHWAITVFSLFVFLSVLVLLAKALLDARANGVWPPPGRPAPASSAAKARPAGGVKTPPGVLAFQQLIAAAAPEDREWFAKQAANAGIELPATGTAGGHVNFGDKP